MSDIKQLLVKDIKPLRDKILQQQNGVCGICGKEPDVATLDHEHAKGFGGTGLIRGVLCRNCNSLEGKISRACRRFGIKIQDIPQWLRSLANWLEKPQHNYRHPTEIPIVKIGKRAFDTLMTKYCIKYPKRKALKYPKGGKATQRLKDIIKEFDD